MNPLDEVLTTAEAEQLWHLQSGTVRRRCWAGLIECRKSGGTWLTTKSAMAEAYFEQPPAAPSDEWLKDRDQRSKDKREAARFEGSRQWRARFEGSRQWRARTHQESDVERCPQCGDQMTPTEFNSEAIGDTFVDVPVGFTCEHCVDRSKWLRDHQELDDLGLEARG